MDISKTLRRSLAELRTERVRLDQQISAIETALGALGGGRGGRGRTAGAMPRKRRPMNAAARKALSQRMRAYWAKRRAAKAQGKRGTKAAAS